MREVGHLSRGNSIEQQLRETARDECRISQDRPAKTLTAKELGEDETIDETSV